MTKTYTFTDEQQELVLSAMADYLRALDKDGNKMVYPQDAEAIQDIENRMASVQAIIDLF